MASENPATLLKTLYLGPGCDLKIYGRESEPEDSLDKYYILNHYDGKPDSTILEVPPHWHKNHDEYISILEGKAEVTLEGKTHILKAGDEPILLPRWHTHSIKGIKGVPLTLKESADPAGLYKALFFNDLLSQGKMPGFLHALRSFYDGDTYIALPGGIKLVDQAFMNIAGGIAKLFAEKKPSGL